MAKRKLKEALPDGEPPVDVWKNELSQLEQEYRQQSAQASLLWKESKKLRELQVLVDEVFAQTKRRERERAIRIIIRSVGGAPMVNADFERCTDFLGQND